MKSVLIAACLIALTASTLTYTENGVAFIEDDMFYAKDGTVGNVQGTCGGNCPSNTCPGCPCGSSKSVQNIANMCAKYSGWNQSQCQCIMSHESGGNANAANYNTNGSYDIGLWQINSMNWSSCSSGAAPCNIDTNLNCAIKVWEWGGKTFKLWSTCKTCNAC